MMKLNFEVLCVFWIFVTKYTSKSVSFEDFFSALFDARILPACYRVVINAAVASGFTRHKLAFWLRCYEPLVWNVQKYPAERVGFEPTSPIKGRRLATCCFEPLSHLSNIEFIMLYFYYLFKR